MSADKKLKVYFYDGSRDPSPFYEGMGYIDCVPFSKQGVERWIEPVSDPYQADFLFAGQFHDTRAWRLTEGRFEYFSEMPEKHIFDIEGDWRGMTIPEWLQPAVLIAMNARPLHREWRLMTRPGSSKLLVELARNRMCRAVSGSLKHQIWFRGQQDSWGLRSRLVNLLTESVLPVDVGFNQNWSAVADVSSQVVNIYEQGMLNNTFILAPGGEGWGATLRMYEACYYGRIPIVISECLVTWEDVVDTSFMVRLSPHATDEELLKSFQDVINMPQSEVEDRCHQAALYFQHVMVPYFRDPTAFFIRWLEKKKIISLRAEEGKVGEQNS